MATSRSWSQAAFERSSPRAESRTTSFGISSRSISVVKIGYLVPDLFAAAKGWLLALTPGGVDQDIVRLGHRDLLRPIFPLDPRMPSPDLSPELLRR